VRLADDPWARSHQLRIVSIEPWKILVGIERLGRGNDEAAERLDGPLT
jgi:hypothetical protein